MSALLFVVSESITISTASIASTELGISYSAALYPLLS
jgi:hypothetical protein